jgi:hypothetical protein
VPPLKGGCAKTIRINLGVIEVMGPATSCAKFLGATKIRTFFFYPSIVRYSLEEGDRQLEKLELTERSKGLYEIVG